MSKKIFISCGEISGENYAAQLIQHLCASTKDITIQTTGSKVIQDSEQCKVVADYAVISFIGFFQAIKKFWAIFSYSKKLKRKIRAYNPDVIILIDSYGFHSRLMKWAKKCGFKTTYFIPPKIWAWNEKRGKRLTKYCDNIISILSFEQAYYKNKWNTNVEYYGHPLSEKIYQSCQESIKINIKNAKNKLIAVSPGSRKDEVKYMAKIIARVSQKFKHYKFVFCQAPNIPDEYFNFLKKNRRYHNIMIVKDNTYDIFRQSSVGIIKSGTSTLEAALFKLPQVVCYKGSILNYILIKCVIKISLYSLPNLILNKLLVTELIQFKMTTSHIRKQLTRILTDEQAKKRILEGYKEIEKLTGMKTLKQNPAESITRKIALSILNNLK